LSEPSPSLAALGRASRRAVFHLIQAAIEGLKAIEAVIEEVGSIGDSGDQDVAEQRKRIEIE
jgi:hypothetical protein